MDLVRSATALLIAISFIFGAAMIAEFAGLVPRDVTSTPVTSADAAAPPGASDEAAASEAEAFQADAPEWADLRIGVIGGFLVACIFILMRSSGDFF